MRLEMQALRAEATTIKLVRHNRALALAKDLRPRLHMWLMSSPEAKSGSSLPDARHCNWWSATFSEPFLSGLPSSSTFSLRSLSTAAGR
jgi:hypothetical protein